MKSLVAIELYSQVGYLYYCFTYIPTYLLTITHLSTYPCTHPPTYNPEQKCCMGQYIHYWTVHPPFKHESLSPPLPPLPSPSLPFSPFNVAFTLCVQHCTGEGSKGFNLNVPRTLDQNCTLPLIHLLAPTMHLPTQPPTYLPTHKNYLEEHHRLNITCTRKHLPLVLFFCKFFLPLHGTTFLSLY